MADEKPKTVVKRQFKFKSKMADAPSDAPHPDAASSSSGVAFDADASTIATAAVNEIQSKLNRLSLIYEINRDFHSTLDVDALIPKVFSKVLSAVNAEAGSFWLSDDDKDVNRCDQAFGPGSDGVRGLALPKGEGIVGWVIKMKKPTIVKDASQDKRFAGKTDAKTGFITQSMICVPLVAHGGEVSLGAIQVLNKKQAGGLFTDDDLDLCKVLAENAGAAIMNARAYASEKKARERIHILNEFNKAQSTTLDLEKLLNIILQRVAGILEAEAGSVWLLEQGQLACAVAFGPSSGKLIGAKVGLGTGIVGNVVQRKEPIIVEDTAKSELFSSKVDDSTGFKTESLITVPLLHQNEALGAIQVINKKDHREHFGKQDLELLQTLAGLSTSAIKNAKLYEVERKAKDLSTLLDISKQVSSSLDLDSVMATVVNLSSQLVPYDRAAMFLMDKDKYSLRVISGEVSVDMDNPVNKAIQHVAGAIQKETYVPDAPAYAAEQGGIIEIKEYFKAAPHVGSFYARVLADDQGPLGMLTLESKEKDFVKPEHAEMITLLANQVTVSMRNAELYRSVPLLSSLGDRAKGNPVKTLAILGVIAAVIAGVVLIPVSRKVSGNIEIEPLVRNKIYARESGLLSEVNFREGDTIRSGEVFARLSGEDMDREKSKLATKRNIAYQAYMRALGLSNMAEARMKEAEMNQAEREMADLNRKMQNIQIVSPHEGQVLTKDLAQKIGEQISRGTVVGDVVDLSRLQVKLLIPQEQMKDVRVGQELEFKVMAYPVKVFKVKIERLSIEGVPEAEQVLYSAYASIDNPDQLLRAGMSGRGKLLTGGQRVLDVLLEQPRHWYKMNYSW